MLGRKRSAGVKGTYAMETCWTRTGRARDGDELSPDNRQAVLLLRGVDFYFAAASPEATRRA